MRDSTNDLQRGLLGQFYQDPYINIAEAESLVSQIVTSLHKIKDVYSHDFTSAMSRIEIRAKKSI